jgi:pyrophosphate--fructose-6-phosphate 1-phosphotransferase
MTQNTSNFHSQRLTYSPRLPKALQGNVKVEEVAGAQATNDGEIQKLFPHTSNQTTVRLVPSDSPQYTEALTVGVVLSGGPAPGGHNAIAGLYDALKKINPASRLLGFLNGPIGVIQGDYLELTDEIINDHRNTGGFDIIGSGRDKIESDEHIERCIRSLTMLDAKALVVIGGDDSNTNAAILAEEMKKRNAGIQVRRRSALIPPRRPTRTW